MSWYLRKPTIMHLVNKLIKTEHILIVLILLLSVFLNFFKLNEIPSGVYVDEALSGYNAYSVLQTGKDEYGKTLPIAFRFFGSYSPPLYTYLTVIPVWLFALNAFSTRFVSALSGVLMTILVFKFLGELKIFKNKLSPVVGTLLFVISPWNILFARTGYENYLGFFLFSLGLYFAWKGLKDNKYLAMAMVFLSISTYTSYTQRFLAPIFIVGFLLLFKNKIGSIKNIKFLKVGVIISLLIQIPNLYLLTTPTFFTKGSMFYSDVVIKQADKIKLLPNIIAIPLAFIREMSSQYLTYFSPRSLFFLPDPDPQRSMPDLAVFYPWMIVLYLVGLFFLIKYRKNKVHKYILFLLLLSPVLTTLIGDPFSTQRALLLLLPMVFMMSIGVDYFLRKINTKIWLPILILLIFYSSVVLWRSYFVLLPKERAKYWLYGYKDLAAEIKRRPESVFVVDPSRQKPHYIELLFFLEYPPKRYHQELVRKIDKDYYRKKRV